MTTCLYARQTPAWAKWARAHVRDTETVEDADAIREELRRIGQQLAQADELRERRGKVVDEARAAELTQREIALLLGMTEEGLRKAQKSYHGRGRSYGGRLAS